MKRQLLESDFNTAVEELKEFITGMANRCIAEGWSYYTTDNAPETFKDLKQRTRGKRIPIADYGSDTSIYGKDINTLFRFWHDVTHLENNWSFSEEGETSVVTKHLEDAKEYGLSPLAQEILWADTYGQVKYYYKHKRFVENQLDFVWMCLQLGINQACKVRI